MFLVGAVPALLVVFTMKYLTRAGAWLRLKAEGRLPKGSILGAVSGPARGDAVAEESDRRGADLVGRRDRPVGDRRVRDRLQVESVSLNISSSKACRPTRFPRRSSRRSTIAYMLQMIGAAVGMWFITRLCIWLGSETGVLPLGSRRVRRDALRVLDDEFADGRLLDDAADVVLFSWACSPGLRFICRSCFPSRMRSTGTSFCYNLGRFAAAGGSFFSAKLATDVFGSTTCSPLQERYAAMAMCAIFLVALGRRCRLLRRRRTSRCRSNAEYCNLRECNCILRCST